MHRNKLNARTVIWIYPGTASLRTIRGHNPCKVSDGPVNLAHLLFWWNRNVGISLFQAYFYRVRDKVHSFIDFPNFLNIIRKNAFFLDFYQ